MVAICGMSRLYCMFQSKGQDQDNLRGSCLKIILHSEAIKIETGFFFHLFVIAGLVDGSLRQADVDLLYKI